VPHRKTWLCAKPTQLKTFVHHDTHVIDLGTFGGHFKPHISKTVNFKFSQNSPPSHLANSCTPPNLAMCKTRPTQNIRASRLSWYSIGDIWRPFQPSHLKNHEFQFFYRTPHEAMLLSRDTQPKLAEFKTHPTQNFCAARLLWNSFGDIFRTFHPSHIKNHKFHFFAKHLTKQSSYVVPHRQTWPFARPTQLNFCALRLSSYSFSDILRPFQPSHLKNHEF